MNLYLDIETVPGQDATLLSDIAATIKAPGNYKKTESINKWLDENREIEAEKVWRKTALDGTVGEIICLAWAIDDNPVCSLGRSLQQPESVLLQDFMREIEQALERPHTDVLAKPTWIGHYITGFDLRFIWQRCVINNIKPTIAIPYKAKPWGDNVFDTKVEWTGLTSHSGYGSQDAISRALGMAGKGDIDGSKVWDYIKVGRYTEVEHYCRDDVETVRRMHQRMTFSAIA